MRKSRGEFPAALFALIERLDAYWVNTVSSVVVITKERKEGTDDKLGERSEIILRMYAFLCAFAYTGDTNSISVVVVIINDDDDDEMLNVKNRYVLLLLVETAYAQLALCL